MFLDGKSYVVAVGGPDGLQEIRIYEGSLVGPHPPDHLYSQEPAGTWRYDGEAVDAATQAEIEAFFNPVAETPATPNPTTPATPEPAPAPAPEPETAATPIE